MLLGGEAGVHWVPRETLGDRPKGASGRLERGGSLKPRRQRSWILRRMMSEESRTPDPAELVGRALEAANRGDLDAVASSFAEDATFDGRVDTLEGRAVIRSFLEDRLGAYEELEFGLEEVRELGNGVVFAVVVQNGHPAGSAGQLRQREGWVFVLGARPDRTPHDLRGRPGPRCSRAPRAGTGVGDV